MNLEIFKFNDPSGKYYKRNYLEKYYNEELEWILNYCKEKNIIDISFKEMVYLSVNGFDVIPKCKNIHCVNRTKFRNSSIGYRDFCSTKCSTSDINVLKKKTETNIKRFGTKTPAESCSVREKSLKTCQQKYGGNSPMSSKETQDKSKKTLMENWGVDNPNKSEEIIKRRVESFKKNINSYKENFKKTSIERYGVDHPWKNKKIHDKSVLKTKIKKDNVTKDLVIERLGSDKLMDIDYEKDIATAVCSQNHKYEISIWWRNNILFQRYKIKTTICTVCNPIEKHISGQQIAISDFISDNYDGEIVLNSRDIISPYEIDIYLPSLKIGIEFNGLYWHSEEKRGKSYHNDKYLESVKKNIKLIQIWEDDWINKKEIVESFILNKLNKSTRIYARKCIIKELSSSESCTFLRENHLQGDCKSFKKIGLFYNDELVSVMTFSRPRIFNESLMGKESHYELTRFCNKIGITIVGGASKLFKCFVDNFKPMEIISYSDNAISNGELYEKLNFRFDGYTKIGYWYNIDSVREHRFNWRKSRLVELGHDPNKTEEQIMEELGYTRIYNAGNKRWIWNIR